MIWDFFKKTYTRFRNDYTEQELADMDRRWEELSLPPRYNFVLFDEINEARGIDFEKMLLHVRRNDPMFRLTEINRPNGHLVFWAGDFTDTKKPVFFDLAAKHTMVTGTTRYGKTNFLRAMLFSLMYYAHPEYLNLVVADWKGNSFSPFAKVLSLFSGPEKTSQAIESVYEIMRQRGDKNKSSLSAKENISKAYRDRNYSLLQKNKYIVLVIDEWPAFAQWASGPRRKHVLKKLRAIACVGAGLGISLVLGAQSVYAADLDGFTKNNLDNRLSFFLSSQDQYRRLFNRKPSEEAMDLYVGEYIALFDKKFRKCKAPFCKPKTIDNAVYLLGKDGFNFQATMPEPEPMPLISEWIRSLGIKEFNAADFLEETGFDDSNFPYLLNAKMADLKKLACIKNLKWNSINIIQERLQEENEKFIKLK